MLLGHENAWRQWEDALAGERMHHAWLLTGKAGLGKASFAQAAARALVGAGANREHHPDILLLTHGPKDDAAEKKRADGKPFELARSIRIGQIRALQQRLSTRPSMGERRAIIIDPADDLERNAANALLKSLEEPPLGTTFFLIAHRPAGLLPTIRSRCRVLRFPELTNAQLDHCLIELMPSSDPESRRAAIAAAAGSPGVALAFMQMKLAEVADTIGKILVGEGGGTSSSALAEAMGARPDRERILAVLELARRAVAAKAVRDSSNPANLIAAHGELVRLSNEVSTFNYDAGMLGAQIGNLLARAAAASEPVDG